MPPAHDNYARADAVDIPSAPRTIVPRHRPRPANSPPHGRISDRPRCRQPSRQSRQGQFPCRRAPGRWGRGLVCRGRASLRPDRAGVIHLCHPRCVEFGPEIVAHLVADDRDVAGRARGSAPAGRRRRGAAAGAPGGCDRTSRRTPSRPRRREDRTGWGRDRAGSRGREVLDLLQPSTGLSAECREGVVIALDDGRPGVDQRVVPVEQDRRAASLRPAGRASRHGLARLGEADILLAQAAGRGADLAVAHRVAVDLHDRGDEGSGAGDEGFPGLLRFRPE
jgi:hypothetical protein